MWVSPHPQLPAVPLNMAGQQHTKKTCVAKFQKWPVLVRHGAVDLGLKVVWNDKRK